MDARCGSVVAVECRVCGYAGDAGGEGSKFSPEKEHSDITTFQVTDECGMCRHCTIQGHALAPKEAVTPADEHLEEQKEVRSPQEEEDPAAIAGLNSKRRVVSQGDGEGADECVAVSEETLFSIHGLDLSLPVLCDFCPMKFDDFTEFDDHMVTHKECRFFSCQLCSNTYLSWGNLVAHRKACHRGQALSCDACGQKKFHPGVGPVNFPVGGNPIGCEECGEGFSTITQLYRHYRVHGTHSFMPDKSRLNKVPERAAEGPSQLPSQKQLEGSAVQLSASDSGQVCAKAMPEHDKHKYCCRDCNEQFSLWNEMAEYVQRKHTGSNEMLTCSVCCQSRLAGEEFLVHYRSCHKARQTQKAARLCPVCHKAFSQSSALNRHLKLHNALSCHHTCELCGEVVTHSELVLVHARQHYGAELPERYKKLERLLECGQRSKESAKRKSFMCEYCGREFGKKLNLQLHIRRHTGERPYGCQLCGKAFYTNQQLAIHVRRHTGERPYACGVCAKAFTGPTALYVHRKLHDKVKRHLCPHCGKRFFWRSAFVGHVRLHTGERPYRCTICSKAFTLKGKLNFHLKKHAVLACSDCGQNFGSEAELNAHRNERCCVTMVTFVEEGPSGKRDTRIIVVNTEDLDQGNLCTDGTAVEQLVV